MTNELHDATSGNEENPYSAPEQLASVDEDQQHRLATRMRRLGAALIDSLIMSSVVFPIALWAGLYDDFPAIKPDFNRDLGLNCVGLVLFLLFHGYLLHTRAQTLGKAVLSIKIVRSDGSQATLGRIFTRRVVPLWILAIVPGLNLLIFVDLLFIFRRDKRCIHDFIADTIVVDA